MELVSQEFIPRIPDFCRSDRRQQQSRQVDFIVPTKQRGDLMNCEVEGAFGPDVLPSETLNYRRAPPNVNRSSTQHFPTK